MRFEGSRLREAREARALTQTALADLIHKSKGVISQYESNTTTPPPEVVRSLADKLQVLPHFFSQHHQEDETGVLHLRSLASTTKTARDRARARFQWLKRLAAFINQYIRFPRC